VVVLGGDSGGKSRYVFWWMVEVVRTEEEGWSVITIEWAEQRAQRMDRRAVPAPSSKVVLAVLLLKGSSSFEVALVLADSIRSAATTAAFQR
jgi:hypothetical protein